MHQLTRKSPARLTCPALELACVAAAVVFAVAPLSARADDGGVPAAPPSAAPPQREAQAPASAPPAPTVAPAPSAEQVAEAQAAALDVRRDRVLQLIAGTLDTRLDATSVLRVPLDDEQLVGVGGERFMALLERVRLESTMSDGARRRAEQARARALARTSASDPVARAADGFLDALAHYLVLPPSERVAILERHHERRQAATERDRVDLPRVETLRTQTEQLEAYMRGELDPTVDPAPLLELDLSATDELGASAERLARLLAGPDAVADPLARAQLAFDQARRMLLALPASRLTQLAATHLARREAHAAAERARAQAEAEAAQLSAAVSEVHDAVDAREAALEEARRARSAVLRRVAEARARVLGVREGQARRLVELDDELAANEARHQQVSAVLADVVALEQRSLLEGDKAADARTLLARVHTRWDTTRDLWHQQQKRMAAGELHVPLPEELPDDLGETPEDLLTLRAEVLAEGEQLQARVGAAQEQLEDGLHGDSVALNHARLRLLDLVVPEVRETFTGFSGTGLAETRSEAEQIGLRARHSSLAWPRLVESAGEAAKDSALHVAFLVLKVVLLLLAFRWWRRHGGDVLLGLGEDGWLFYAHRVRRPLEWLVLYWVTLYATDAWAVPGVATLTTVIGWMMGGAAAILLLDSFAQRYHLGFGHRSRTAELRLRSLRLIGRAVVAVGLILDLTQQAVGRGAIYGWVIRLCWLLAIPLGVLILRWWKSSIFRTLRMEGDPNRLIRWARERERGLYSYPATAAGGGYLLAMAVTRVALSVAGRADLTQRVRAQLFRRRALRTDDEQGVTRTPVDPGVYGRFGPFETPATSLAGIADGELEDLQTLILAKRTSLSVVVGERGIGKTTFLRRLEQRLGERRVYLISAPDTFHELVTLLAAELEVEDSPVAVAACIREAGPIAICIDDVHRMILPAIGGLAELDQLVVYAREMGGDAAWVLAVEGPAWQYVQRARGEHVFFDRIMVLPKWTAVDIATLLRARSREVGVEPSFDGLVVPRNADGTIDDEVAQKAEGFYGVIWDYAGGNPAVALHCFRESLFTNPEDPAEPFVRLFKEPSSEPIELLPGPMLYVLRAVLQLELARPEDIVQCTALPASDVADALRLALSRGYIEEVPEEDAVRVDFHWFRSLTSVLRRKHLLVE